MNAHTHPGSDLSIVSVSILSDDATRAASLGRLSLSYGVGMICGSFIGGQLGDYFGDAKQVRCPNLAMNFLRKTQN